MVETCSKGHPLYPGTYRIRIIHVCNKCSNEDTLAWVGRNPDQHRLGSNYRNAKHRLQEMVKDIAHQRQVNEELGVKPEVLKGNCPKGHPRAGHSYRSAKTGRQRCLRCRELAVRTSLKLFNDFLIATGREPVKEPQPPEGT